MKQRKQRKKRKSSNKKKQPHNSPTFLSGYDFIAVDESSSTPEMNRDDYDWADEYFDSALANLTSKSFMDVYELQLYFDYVIDRYNRI